MSPSVKAMEELKSSVKKSMKNCWTTFLVNVEANLALSGKDIGNNVNLTLAQESDIQTDILPLTSPPRPLARHDVNNFKTMSTNTSICEHCSKPTTEKYVTEFCETVKDANMTDRCCWNSTALIGLDLTDCNIESLDNLLTNYTSLIVLDLKENNLKNFSEEYFVGLTNLTELYLPPDSNCPGGEAAWNSY
ncbi:All-trans retinoic acid-induced differentiation factor [Nymphon striatum]|nr:All-trans retinoic acid-induced differentiation factor [Nymphon striatum]